LKLKKL